VIPPTQEAETGESWSEVSLEKSTRPYLKSKKKKKQKDWESISVVGCLPRKWEALSSINKQILKKQSLGNPRPTLTSDQNLVSLVLFSWERAMYYTAAPALFICPVSP
jgi:hypothetical protein